MRKLSEVGSCNLECHLFHVKKDKLNNNVKGGKDVFDTNNKAMGVAAHKKYSIPRANTWFVFVLSPTRATTFSMLSFYTDIMNLRKSCCSSGESESSSPIGAIAKRKFSMEQGQSAGNVAKTDT